LTSEERYTLGQSCARLLKDDSFKYAVGKVREDVLNAWMMADLGNTSAQSVAKQTMTGLDLVLSKLNSFADDAKLLDAEAEVKQRRIDAAQARKDKQAEKLRELGLRR
jgi:hypothetical protein